ncbi:MAG: hypothetical protein J6333_04430, partial [Planctomycetes bacterium]|nr:hypothetical protein [Planctomycetota bacterium]
YWQYFTGRKFFEHRIPIDGSNMSRWRQRIGAEGAEKILALTVETGLKAKFIKASECKTVNAARIRKGARPTPNGNGVRRWSR